MLVATAGSLIKEHVVLKDSLMGSQHIFNSEGIPEQAYHTALAVTLDRLLLLGSQGSSSFCASKHYCSHVLKLAAVRVDQGIVLTLCPQALLQSCRLHLQLGATRLLHHQL